MTAEQHSKNLQYENLIERAYQQPMTPRTVKKFSAYQAVLNKNSEKVFIYLTDHLKKALQRFLKRRWKKLEKEDLMALINKLDDVTTISGIDEIISNTYDVINRKL